MRTSIFLAAALVASALQPAISHADFKMCNHSADTVFLMTVSPDNSCQTRQFYNLTLLTQNACHTIISGGARNQVVYYDAWQQTDDIEWVGNFGIWIPGSSGKGCMPTISCKPSEGNFCGGGEVYSMRQFTVPSDNYTLSLVQ